MTKEKKGTEITADPSDGESWLSKFLGGANVPAALLGPAGKALSRLVGAAIDIPAASLEGRAALIRADYENKKLLREKLGERAAELVTNDPEIMDRTLLNWLSEQTIKQKNREDIAQLSVEELENSKSTNSIDGAEISDDWLGEFKTRAERVSRLDAQRIWARVLAGEIETPGRFNLVFLEILSRISQDDAVLIKKYCSRLSENGSIFTDMPEFDDLGELLKIQRLGLIEGAGGVLSLRGKFENNFKILAKYGDDIVLGKDESGKSYAFNCVVASPELFMMKSVLQIEFDPSAVSEFIKLAKQKISNVYTAKDNGAGGLDLASVRQV